MKTNAASTEMTAKKPITIKNVRVLTVFIKSVSIGLY